MNEAHIKCSKDDYMIRVQEGWYQIFAKADDMPDLSNLLTIADNRQYFVYGYNYLGRFINEEQADRFIEGRCNPKEVPVSLYPDVCRCQKHLAGWEYVLSDGIVFERCKKCRNPLRHNILNTFTTKALADFSLDDFLNGD